ncbi:MAG: redoxin domain-containing protein [Frankiales bacterium]|nr:redoxin domain-containing protein [Frankiales bacterium]
MSVEVGQEAPDFELRNQFGTPVRLSSFRGEKNVVLVFFPKAFTATCTSELCAIRDENTVFENDDTVVLGISCDTDATLKVFAETEKYEFDLLSDFWPHGEVATAYGVFLEARGFATRGTFIVDKQGVLRWSVVNSPADARRTEDYREALAAL